MVPLPCPPAEVPEGSPEAGPQARQTGHSHSPATPTLGFSPSWETLNQHGLERLGVGVEDGGPSALLPIQEKAHRGTPGGQCRRGGGSVGAESRRRYVDSFPADRLLSPHWDQTQNAAPAGKGTLSLNARM